MCTVTQIGNGSALLGRFPEGKCLICETKVEDTICKKCAEKWLSEERWAIAVCAQCKKVHLIEKTPLEAHPNIDAVTFIGYDGKHHIYIVGACTRCDPEKKITRVIFEDLVPKSEGLT